MTRLYEHGQVTLEASHHGLTVRGAVDFEVAAALAAAGSAWLSESAAEISAAGKKVVLDLSGVERVSSAAVSTLLQWMRQARSANITIHSVRLSAPLARLTRVAGLDELLPLAGEAYGDKPGGA